MKRRMPMKTAKSTSSFQNAIEAIESLSPEEQAMAVEIIERRLTQQRRADLVQRVAETRADYQRGRFRRGSVEDFMAELDS